MNFFDPSPEQQNIVLIDTATLHKAQSVLSGCEACSDTAQLPFDYILDELTGYDPSVTDYILEMPATCSECGATMNAKTLVDLA